MISKITNWFLVGISLVLLTATAVAAQVTDEGYRIFRPDGPGPHPAVVFVSGCSGFTPAFAPKGYELWAERLRGLGFVVVWADYLGRRNLQSCAVPTLTQHDAGQDAVAAASWLRSKPYVNAKRITAMGWSYGGGCVLAALGSHTADELIFSRVIVFYPHCSGVGSWSNRIPVLVLRAGSDNVALPRTCESAFGTASLEGNVKIIDYPGAHHAFDMSELPPKTEYRFGTLGYDPKAAAAAWDEVQRFLQPGK